MAPFSRGRRGAKIATAAAVVTALLAAPLVAFAMPYVSSGTSVTLVGGTPDRLTFDGSGNATTVGPSAQEGISSAGVLTPSTAGATNRGTGPFSDGSSRYYSGSAQVAYDAVDQSYISTFDSSSLAGYSNVSNCSAVGVLAWAPKGDANTTDPFYDRRPVTCLTSSSGVAPSGVSVDATGRVYVSQQGQMVQGTSYMTDQVVVYNAGSLGVQTTYGTGPQGTLNGSNTFLSVPTPGKSLYDAAGNRVFVFSGTGATTGIDVISGTNGTPSVAGLVTANSGIRPSDMRIDTATNKLYVTGSNAIYVYNLATAIPTLTETITLSFTPTWLNVQSASLIYAVGGGSYAQINNSTGTGVINTNFGVSPPSGTVTGVWTNPVTGAIWFGVANKIYIGREAMPPVITGQPASVTTGTAGNVTFTVTDGGTEYPAPTYRWQYSTDGGTTWTNFAAASGTLNGSAYSGALTGTLTYAAAAASNLYQFRDVLTNISTPLGVAGVNSNAATLTFLTPVSVTTNPTSQSKASGSTVTLTSAATGYPTPTVQWQSAPSGSSTFTNISGATSATYTFTMAAGLDGSQYRAVWSNTTPTTATSTAATITLNSAPAFTSAASNSVPTNTAYSHPFTVTGGGPITWAYTVSSGTLPTGVTFNTSTGTLSGTPTTVGTVVLSVTATNAATPPGTQTYTLTTGNPPVLPTSLPAAAVGTAYTGTAAVTSGTGPLTYSVTAGSLPAGLALNSSTGAITGTPTAAGSASFTIQATSAFGTTTQAYTVATTNPVVLLPTSPVNTPVVWDSTSSIQIPSTGSAPINYTVASSTGGMNSVTNSTGPAGFYSINLDPNTGVLSWNNLQFGGTGTITITATNLSGAATSTRTYTIVGGKLPDPDAYGSRSSSVTQNDAAASITYSDDNGGNGGGTSPSTYAGGYHSGPISNFVATAPTSLTSGNISGLPAGMTLNNSTGVLSGTPTTAGTYQFSLSATGPVGVGTNQVTVTVNAPVIWPSLPNGMVGVPYSYDWGSAVRSLNSANSLVTGSGVYLTYEDDDSYGGGSSGNSYDLSSIPGIDGAFAASPTFYTGGVITGTPTTAGTYTLILGLEDQNGGPLGTHTYTFTVTAAVAPTFTSTSLPGGAAGTAYSQPLPVTGATSYGTTGTLPTGLTVNASTGVVSGTLAAGSYSFTATATNATGTTTQLMTLVIGNPPSYAGVTNPSAQIEGTALSGVSLAVSSGDPTITYATSSTLPAGLTLNTSTGALTGTPAAGTAASSPYTIAMTATNAYGSDTHTFTLVVNQTPAFGSATPTSGVVGTAYTTFTPTVTGTGPMIYSISTGSLPAGLTLNTSTGAISGTPTAPGSVTFTMSVTGATGVAATNSYTIAVNQAPSFTGATPPADGIETQAYSSSVAVTAAFPAATYSLSSGALPTGLTLSSSGAITGTPAAGTAGVYTIGVTASNGISPAATRSFTFTIRALPVLGGTAPSAVAGQAYAGFTPTLVSGTSPITAYALTSGSVPAGLTFSTSTGAISGTPSASASGTTSTFSIAATNAAGTGAATTYTITVNAAPSYAGYTQSTTSGQTGSAYSLAVAATAGTPTITYAVTAGSLPAGLSLNTATGTISGTPTAVTSGTSVTVTATNGYGSATATVNIVVNSLPTITGTPPSGTTGVAYTYTPTVTGNGSLAFTATGLPAGLSINASTGVVSGTPTAGGTFPFTITVTGPGGSATQSASMTIGQAPSYAGYTQSTTSGVTGAAYSLAVAATAGSPTITYAITAGSLPAGLSLNTATGTISGTPTAVTTGTSVTVTATNGYGSATATVNIVVNSLPTITGTPASGTTGVAYTYTPTVTGNGSLAFTATGLPAGLSINAGTGVVSGTPTAGGTFPFTITVTGPGGSATQSASLSIAQAPSYVGFTAPPAGLTNVPYTGSIAAPIGTTLTYAITTGSLPVGLTLNPATGAITGVPTVAGPVTFTVTATNSTGTASQLVQVTIVISAQPVFTSTAPTSAVAGTALNYAPTVTGTGPITYAASGTLPAGLTLNTATGVVSGTPTTPGTYSFGITATGPGGSTTQPIALTVNSVPSYLGFTQPSGSVLGQPYTGSIAAPTPAGGTYAITAGSLPAGLTLNPATGAITGTPTSTTSAPFTVTVTNLYGSATQTFTIPVSTLPAFTGTTALTGITGIAVSQSVAATGSGPISYAVTSGALPAGLTLNTATGAITGTPTAAGSSNFTVTATNTAGSTAQPFTYVVTSPPVFAQGPLPSGTVGTGYTTQIIPPTGGPATYTVISGSLPSGLSLSPTTGVISGTPTTAGTQTFQVSATNSTGVAVQVFILPINPAQTNPPSFAIALPPSSLSGAVVSQMPSAAGTYTYAVGVGSLPAGLSLNPATGAVTGTVTTAGVYRFTIVATDGGLTTTHAYVMAVKAASVPDLDIKIALQLAVGASAPNAPVFATAAGLMPGSVWAAYMHSTPVLIGSGRVGSSGEVDSTLHLPKSVPAGWHTIVLTGVSAAGATVTASARFHITSAHTLGTDSAVTPTPTPTPVATSGTGLAETGFDLAAPLWAAGIALLLGLALVVISGRRRRRDHNAAD